MVRHCPYHSSSKLYEDYYGQQVGHGLPVFVGGRTYRGHGLGNILAGIGRAVVPLLKKGGKVLLKEGAKTGIKVAQDVLSGQKFGTSIKQRANQAGKRLFNQAVEHASGYEFGPKRIKHAKAAKKNQKAIQKRRKTKKKMEKATMNDIFG